MKVSAKHPTINQAFCRCFMFAVGFIVFQMFALEYYLESQHPTVMARDTINAIEMIPYEDVSADTNKRKDQPLDEQINVNQLKMGDAVHRSNEKTIGEQPIEPMITIKEHQAILSFVMYI